MGVRQLDSEAMSWGPKAKSGAKPDICGRKKVDVVNLISHDISKGSYRTLGCQSYLHEKV